MKLISQKIISILLAATIFVVATPIISMGQVIDLDPQLKNYIAAGLKNSPDIEVWQNKVEASRHNIPQAGAWQDPTVGIGLMNLPVNSFDFNQEPMTGLWFNAAQMIPLAGMPKLKTKIAEINLETTLHDRRDKELSIASSIAQTWYDWAYLDAALLTVEANIELIDNLVTVARSKYETGRGMQQDILRAQTKRTRLDDKLASLRQMKLTMSRRFALLLGETGITGLQNPAHLPDSFTELNVADLSAELFVHNSLYLKTKAELKTSELKSDLAKKSWVPDLKLGAGYGFRQNADNGMERPDFFTVTAGMSVPLFGERKQGRAVQEMQAMERAVHSKLRSVELGLQFQLDKLLDEDQRLDKQIMLYQDGIEPQAEATLAASTFSYSVGKADFEALLMAETALYNARLERLARIRDRIKVRISIAALIGDEILNPETSESE